MTTLNERMAALEARFQELVAGQLEDAKTRREEIGEVRKLIEEIEKKMDIPPEQHRQAHNVLTAWIQREEMHLKRMERVKTSVLGWLLISCLGGIGMVAWKGFLVIFNLSGKGP